MKTFEVGQADKQFMPHAAAEVPSSSEYENQTAKTANQKQDVSSHNDTTMQTAAETSGINSILVGHNKTGIDDLFRTVDDVNQSTVDYNG